MLPVGKLNKGYTLLELLLVILLLGIILFTATPRLRDIIAGDPLSLAVKRLGSLCSELRAQAVSEQRDYFLMLDLDERRFFAYREDLDPEERLKKREKAFFLGEGVRFTKVDTFRDETHYFGDLTIRFSREGYAQPALIYLEREDERRTLFLNPLLPAVKVWERHIERTDLKTETDEDK